MSEQHFIDAFREAYPDLTASAEFLRDKRVSVVVKRDGLVEAARALKERFGFTHPMAAGGMDYPKKQKMQMIYYLLNPESKIILTLRVDLPRDDLELPSLTRVWEAMSFHEREAHEMFGFYFEGHGNLIPLLLPPGWAVANRGYPLRKDFKLEGD